MVLRPVLPDLSGRLADVRRGDLPVRPSVPVSGPLLPVLGPVGASATAGPVASTVLSPGALVSCRGAAALSAACAVAAGPSQAGQWVAVIGVPGFGVAAAEQVGVVGARLVRVDLSSGVAAGVVAEVVAGAIDGFGVVLLGPQVELSPAVVRRLLARAQQRATLLVHVHLDLDGGRRSGPGASSVVEAAADVRLTTTSGEWIGLGDGHGAARARRVEVTATGRRVTRERRATVWLPSPPPTAWHASDTEDAHRAEGETRAVASDATARAVAIGRRAG